MKPCPSFPGYSVESDGRVFTHRRGLRIRGQQGGKFVHVDPSYARELLGVRSAKGYITVGIRVAASRSRPVGVHQLVADAFLGPCPVGQQVRHLDGNPSNNRLENLAYGTARDNAQDRARHGRYASGAKHHGARLMASDVASLLMRRSRGEKIKDLAIAFRVSVATIESVLYGKTYRAEAQAFHRLHGGGGR